MKIQSGHTDRRRRKKRLLRADARQHGRQNARLFVFLSHKSVRLAGFSIHTFWQTGFLNTGESRHLFAYFPSIQTQFRIRFEPEALGWHDHCTMTEFLRNIYRQLFLYYSKISRVTPPQLNGFIVYHKTRVQKLVPI